MPPDECHAAWPADAERNVDDDDLFMVAPFGYALIRPTGRILRINRTAEKILDKTCRELVGINFAELIAPKHQSRFESHLRRSFESGRRETVDLEFKGIGGRSLFARSPKPCLSESCRQPTFPDDRFCGLYCP